MKTMPLILAIVLLAGATALAGEPAHVKARLIADVDHIQPGKPFTVAVVFDIDADWHIYWKNPGDAGLATRIKLTAPDGFIISEIRYPTPKKFEQPGKIIAYGYERQTALLATITPPEKWDPANPAAITAAASWLVCSDVCIPGKADLKLTVPADKPDAATVAQYAAQVPTDFTDQFGSIAAHADAKPDGNRTNVAVTVDIIWKQPPTGDAIFLPGISQIYNIRNAKITTDGKATHVQFTAQTLAGKKPEAQKLELVLNYPDTTGDIKAVRLWVNLPGGEIGK